MKTIINLMILGLCMTISLGQNAKDPKTNTIDGTDDAEFVPELAGKNNKEVVGTDNNTVVVKSKSCHTSAVFFGSGIRFSHGKIYLNGKEITIEKTNGTIHCNTIECPSESIKCAVRQVKNPDNKNESIITSECADKNNKVLLSDKKTEPLSAETGNGNDHEAYAELSYGEGSSDILNSEVAAEIEKTRSEFDKIQKDILDSFRSIWDSNPFSTWF